MPEVTEEIRETLDTLTRSVTEMREGQISRDDVEQTVAEALASHRESNRDGYNPEDHLPDERAVLGGDLATRMAQIHSRDATAVAGLLRMEPSTVREFQVRSDELLALQVVMSRSDRDYDVRESRFYQDTYAPLVRAMDTQTTAEGVEWVPTQLSGDLVRRVELELKVSALFSEINMPTAVFELPAEPVTRVRSGIHTEQTADTGQTKFAVVTPGTRKVTMTSKKLAVRALVSREAEEDAIVAILPWIVEQLVKALAYDFEDAIVNGDTTATHMDSDVTGTDPRKLWLGLRKLTQAGQKSDAGSDKLTPDDLLANRKKLGKYGAVPDNLAHVVSVASFIDLLSDDAVETVDKFGPHATILSGQLAAVHGVPVIVSEVVRTDLNATGVYDGTTTTQTVGLTVYKPGFLRGIRRGIRTETLTELYAESDQDAVIASSRRAFAALYPTSEPTVALSYNADA